MEEKYKQAVEILMREFEIKNRMAVPRIIKVVINSGVGALSKNKEMLDAVVRDMALITGQKPSVRRG